MTIKVYWTVSSPHQGIYCQKLMDGFKKHGVSAELLKGRHPEPCDLAVFWGMHHTSAIREMQRKNKADYLLMERAYVGDRFNFVSLGYNGLNGRGEYLNENSPPDRWNKHFKGMMKPYHGGDYVLMTGQVPRDASLAPFELARKSEPERRNFFSDIARQVIAKSGVPVHYRPHPLFETETPPGCITVKGQTLEQELSKAKLCFTINSNSGVDAILSGTPVVNLDHGSMVWDIAGHGYEDIKNPPINNRDQWAYDISYAQWLPEEIEAGDAWDHLKKKYI